VSGDHLIALDFDPEVAAVAARPFSLSFEASDRVVDARGGR